MLGYINRLIEAISTAEENNESIISALGGKQKAKSFIKRLEKVEPDEYDIISLIEALDIGVDPYITSSDDILEEYIKYIKKELEEDEYSNS